MAEPPVLPFRRGERRMGPKLISDRGRTRGRMRAVTRPCTASLLCLLSLALEGAAAAPPPAAAPGLATRAPIVRGAPGREPPDDALVVVRALGHAGGSRSRDAPYEGGRTRRFRAGRRVSDGAGRSRLAACATSATFRPSSSTRLRFAARKARELGLRMDVTIGSGWSYGGPYITQDLAAARLRSERREITPDRTQMPRPVPYDGDRLVAAFIGRGSVQEADPRTFRELDLSGDGPIALPAGNGPRVVLFYFASHSGQIVKRAALGAEGYVLDHFSRPAIEMHLREAGDKLLGAAGPGGVHAIFCDSLEVYDADWTGGPPRAVPLPPRVRPPAAAPALGARRGRPLPGSAARRRPHAQRALRGALPRAARGVGEEEQRAPADPELRRAAGHDLQLAPCGPDRRRRLEVPRAHVVALGLVRFAPVRPARHHLGDVDVAPFARVPRHAARREGGGRPALPGRHQPAHRPRLALLAPAGGHAGLAVLRRRRPLRQEPVVAGDARPRRATCSG